jgi:rhamnogalacturonan endolyase
VRPEPYTENVNNWTILFDASEKDLRKKQSATFTIQLAGAKTAAGNTDLFNATQPYNNLPLNVEVNGKQLEAWVIP